MIALLASVVLGSGDLACAVMGSAAPMNTPNAVDFGGVRYAFCCGGCPEAFSKEPAKYIKKAADGKAAIGYFLFEPITGAKLDIKKMPTLSEDFRGTRYFFASAEDQKTFDAKHDAFAKVPKKEVLYCSVMGHEVEDYSKAGAYADHEGVRYYFCCTDCRAAFVKEPAKYAEGVKGKVQDPKALKPGKGS